MYFQVVGPSAELNEAFVEKMSNAKHAILNDFRVSTEKTFDTGAYKNYFILSDELDIDHSEREQWMQFYYENNKFVWVTEF